VGQRKVLVNSYGKGGGPTVTEEKKKERVRWDKRGEERGRG